MCANSKSGLNDHEIRDGGPRQCHDVLDFGRVNPFELLQNVPTRSPHEFALPMDEKSEIVETHNPPLATTVSVLRVKISALNFERVFDFFRQARCDIEPSQEAPVSRSFRDSESARHDLRGSVPGIPNAHALGRENDRSCTLANCELGQSMK